jgi:hypothetical protein
MWSFPPPVPPFPMTGNPFYPPDFHAKRAAIKQKFSPEEDQYLRHLVSRYGPSDWKQISLHMNGRTVRQCRERWKSYLEPSLNKLDWTAQEDQLLLQKYEEIGPKWSRLALYFHARTDIDVRNRYHRIERITKKAEAKITDTAVNEIESQSATVPTGFLGMALEQFHDTESHRHSDALPMGYSGKGTNPPAKRIVCARIGEIQSTQRKL